MERQFKDLNEIDFVSADLCELAKGLIEAGIEVIVTKWSTGVSGEYFHYSDGNKIVYAQSRRFGGLRFSSIRKGSRKYGTGSSFQGYEEYIYDVTVDEAVKYLSFSESPNMAQYAYKDLDEYLEIQNKQNKDQYLLKLESCIQQH
jgi:hypothetical protein